MDKDTDARAEGEAGSIVSGRGEAQARRLLMAGGFCSVRAMQSHLMSSHRISHRRVRHPSRCPRPSTHSTHHLKKPYSVRVPAPSKPSNPTALNPSLPSSLHPRTLTHTLPPHARPAEPPVPPTNHGRLSKILPKPHRTYSSFERTNTSSSTALAGKHP